MEKSLVEMKAQLSSSQERILKVLKHTQREISAQELYAELRHHNQNLGLATVYRILKALTLKGLARARTSTNGESLYSLVEEDRHYLTCLHCGASIALADCPICNLETTLRQSKLFTIYYHTLEFFGLCSSCQQQLKT